MCSPVVPHNDEKGYGWWSRAARILKTLWCKSPTDSTKKIVPLLLFCIMFLAVRSMSQSSLHQNIIYIFFYYLDGSFNTSSPQQPDCLGEGVLVMSAFHRECPVQHTSTYMYRGGKCRRAESCIKPQCSLLPFSRIEDKSAIWAPQLNSICRQP